MNRTLTRRGKTDSGALGLDQVGPPRLILTPGTRATASGPQGAGRATDRVQRRRSHRCATGARLSCAVRAARSARVRRRAPGRGRLGVHRRPGSGGGSSAGRASGGPCPQPRCSHLWRTRSRSSAHVPVGVWGAGEPSRVGHCNLGSLGKVLSRRSTQPGILADPASHWFLASPARTS